jgi:hypothetical protein
VVPSVDAIRRDRLLACGLPPAVEVELPEAEDDQLDNRAVDV